MGGVQEGGEEDGVWGVEGEGGEGAGGCAEEGVDWEIGPWE